MVTRHEKLSVIEALKIKKALVDKINFNKREVIMLEALKDAATNQETIKQIGNEIKRGRGLVSNQTTELMTMSEARLCRKLNVTRSVITYQWRLLTGV